MSKSIWFAKLVVPLILVAHAAAASPPVALLIDYTRLGDGGVIEPPAWFRGLVGRSIRTVRLEWVNVGPVDSVRLGLRDGDVPLTVDLADVERYRSAVVQYPALNLSNETLAVLRSRARELALSSHREPRDLSGPAPRERALLDDARVRGELPEYFDPRTVHAKFLVRPKEGGVRLHLWGAARAPDADRAEAFTRTVDFMDLDDFNRASGEVLTGADFWRPTLYFWREGLDRPTAYVMKTRTEAAIDCSRHLIGSP